MATEHDHILQLIERAAKQAATEIGSWYPVIVGDHVAGEVVEVGSLFTDFNARNPRRPSGLQINEYATTTIRTIGSWTMEGNTSEEEALLRLVWLGAISESTFERYRPVPGDFIAQHYQKDVAPKSGLNEYKLNPSVIIDRRTQLAKLPVNMTYAVPTERDLAIMADMAEPVPGVDVDGVVTPDMAAWRAARQPERPVYPPFTDDDTPDAVTTETTEATTEAKGKGK